MTKIQSALHSAYIIDGCAQEFSPAQLLDAVSHTKGAAYEDSADPIIDESLDPVVCVDELDPSRIEDYLSGLYEENNKATRKRLSLAFSESYSRFRIALALINCLWKQGSFRLGDLWLKAGWKWNFSKVGSAAAFYHSVESAAEYIDTLGLQLSSYSFDKGLRPEFSVKAILADDYDEMDSFYTSQTYRSKSPIISDRRACPSSLVDDPKSWLIYLPFDTCDFRLGDSLLSQTLRVGGGVSPRLEDADYFIDCFEVIREFVEDGILISAATVGEGGLIKAVKDMTTDEIGITIDISDIINAYQEKDIVKVLFSEIPGVVIQIRDIDFDYLDAELLLQDVAYFPLGHPCRGEVGVRIKSSAKTAIQTILESLIRNAEGED